MVSYRKGSEKATCSRCAMSIPADAQVCPYCRTNFSTFDWLCRCALKLVVLFVVLYVVANLLNK